MLLHIARFHLFLWLNSILVCVCVCGPHLHSSIHPLVGTEQLFSYLSYGKSTIPSFNIPFFFLGFHGGLAGKQSACNTGDLGSVPGLGRSPGEGKGYQLQYSGLENSMTVHGVAKSWTRLSNFTSLPFIKYPSFFMDT